MSLRQLSFLYTFFLVLSLATVLFGYRYFVSIPALVRTIDQFHQRELGTLNQAVEKEISFLKTINFDYSAWDDSYDFIQQLNIDYVQSNLIDDTFISLKVDGMYFYDNDDNMVWGKGFDHVTREPIGFSELNIKKYPHFKNILPIKKDPNDATLVPQKAGFILTKQGPSMYSATQLRHSNHTGEPVGVLVFIRKIRPSFIQSLEQISQLELSSTNIHSASEVKNIPKLDSLMPNESFRFKRQRLINDPNGEPVILLNIQHQNSVEPELFDKTMLLTFALLALIPLVVLAFVNRKLITPVTLSTNKIRQMIEEHDFRHLKSFGNIREIQQLTADFNQLITTVNKHEDTLKHLVLTDELSKIANRRAFEQFISASWARMQRNQQPIAVIMVDIDSFKAYNDNYGHQQGDQVIVQVAQILHKKINRASDIVARYGGEEFVIVLADSGHENCQSVVKIILESIRDLQIPHHFSGVCDYLTVSVGAAVSVEIDDVPLKVQYSHLIHAADEALYQAKNSGRNRAVKVLYNAQTGSIDESIDID